MQKIFPDIADLIFNHMQKSWRRCLLWKQNYVTLNLYTSWISAHISQMLAPVKSNIREKCTLMLEVPTFKVT